MKFRLSNGIDYSHEFQSNDIQSLKIGCKLGWRKYIAHNSQQIFESRKWVNDNIQEINERYNHKKEGKVGVHLQDLTSQKNIWISKIKSGFMRGKHKKLFVIPDGFELHIYGTSEWMTIYDRNVTNKTYVSKSLNLSQGGQDISWKFVFDRARNIKEHAEQINVLCSNITKDEFKACLTLA